MLKPSGRTPEGFSGSSRAPPNRTGAFAGALHFLHPGGGDVRLLVVADVQGQAFEQGRGQFGAGAARGGGSEGVGRAGQGEGADDVADGLATGAISTENLVEEGPQGKGGARLPGSRVVLLPAALGTRAVSVYPGPQAPSADLAGRIWPKG